MTSIQNSLSGLNASATRLNVSASNTANQLSTYGEVDGKPVNQPYQAQQVQDVSQQPGGVKSVVLLADPATVQVYDPSSAVADTDGLVNVPNVSQEGEAINRLLAANAYKANLSVLQTEDETTQSLLSATA